MKLNSLGRRTDLIFVQFSGSVIDKGAYILIQTPNNPEFHWGNYIIFDRAPEKGSMTKWKKIFDQEFKYYSKPQHYVFTWDTVESSKGDHQEFLDAGFEMDSATVLTAAKLVPPKYFNTKIEIRPIKTDQEWKMAIDSQILYADPKFTNDKYQQFKQRQMDSYRRMSESGLGSWFGAFIGPKLVGDLGIFFENGIGRYQNVGTHPDYRKQGICGTLVYVSGLYAFEKFGVNQLVMEADTSYHAARIYESVGFKSTEVNHALSWWNGK